MTCPSLFAPVTRMITVHLTRLAHIRVRSLRLLRVRVRSLRLLRVQLQIRADRLRPGGSTAVPTPLRVRLLRVRLPRISRLNHCRRSLRLHQTYIHFQRPGRPGPGWRAARAASQAQVVHAPKARQRRHSGSGGSSSSRIHGGVPATQHAARRRAPHAATAPSKFQNSGWGGAHGSESGPQSGLSTGPAPDG